MWTTLAIFVTLLATAHGQGGSFLNIDCTATDSSNCPPGTNCGSYQDPFTNQPVYKCKCNTGYFNNGINQCVKINTGIGDACDPAQNVECDANLHLICGNNVCACISGFTNVNGNCTKHVGHGEACNPATFIICDGANTACVNGNCSCEPNYRYHSDNGKCVMDMTLNEGCNDTFLCTARNAVCTNNTCLCAANYYELNSTCVTAARFGEVCNTSDVICGEAHTQCVNGTCACVANFSRDQGACAKDVPLLAPCGTHARCGVENSTCHNGTCVCRPDNTKMGDFCVSTTLEHANSLNVPCQNNANCTVTGSHCAQVAAGNGATQAMCVCNVAQAWELQDTNGIKKCVKAVQIGHICQTGLAYCRDDNAECKMSTDLSGTHRCVCKDGYTDVDGKCALVVPTQRDPACKECIDNNAICYDNVLDDGVMKKEGCKCPAGHTGDKCDISVVDVHCPADPFYMVVCYTPRQQGDMVFVDGRANNVECRGFPVIQTGQCQAGQVQVSLPLATARLGTCGTMEISGDGTRKFTNTISIVDAQGGMVGLQNFAVYCEFVSSAAVGTPGIVAMAIPQNNRGQTFTPDITATFENSLRQPVADGVALRRGDAIYFVIELDGSGDTYGAITVEACIASNSGRPDDFHATSRQMLMNGCPAPGQQYFNDANGVQQSADGRKITLGPFPVFGVGDGNNVYFHCLLQVCLRGDEPTCTPVTCGSAGSVRRKRDLEEDETLTEVTRELIWYEEEESELEIAYSTFLSVTISLSILLLIFIILCVFLLWQLCMRSGKVEDLPPQRFALPRMNNNPHLRL